MKSAALILAATLAAGGCASRSRAAFTTGVATTLAGGILISQDTDDRCMDCTGLRADFENNQQKIGVSMLVVGAVMMLVGYSDNGTSE